MHVKDASEILGANVYRDGEFSNLGFSIHDGPGLLTWLEKRKFLPGILKNSGISAVIAPPDLAATLPEGLGVITHEQPRDAFYQLHNHLARQTQFYGQADKSTVHPSAKVSPHAHVDEMGVVIGENTIVEAGATILAGTSIGAGCMIRAGAVLGSQGFQFTKMGGQWVGVDHVGGVWLQYRVPTEFFWKGKKLVRVPFFYQDNIEMENPRPVWRADKLLDQTPEVKVTNIYPIYIYLNAHSMKEDMNGSRQRPSLFKPQRKRTSTRRSKKRRIRHHVQQCAGPSIRLRQRLMDSQLRIIVSMGDKGKS